MFRHLGYPSCQGKGGCYSAHMDMEQLSKSQIVLLTLLVSFVTSMATGIVAVSLVDQAPIGVVQTVNRVIEKTVETVAAPVVHTAAAAAPKAPAPVAEADQVAAAVAKAAPSVVRIYSDEGEASTFLGLGAVVDPSGMIAADSWGLEERAGAILVLADGAHVRASVTTRSKPLAIALLRAATSTTDGKPVLRWASARLGGDPALGARVVVLAGRSNLRVGEGIVAAFSPVGESSPARIDTTLPADAILSGSMLIGADGSLVGLSTGVARSADNTSFIPASAFAPILAAALK